MQMPLTFAHLARSNRSGAVADEQCRAAAAAGQQRDSLDLNPKHYTLHTRKRMQGQVALQ